MWGIRKGQPGSCSLVMSLTPDWVLCTGLFPIFIPYPPQYRNTIMVPRLSYADIETAGNGIRKTFSCIRCYCKITVIWLAVVTGVIIMIVQGPHSFETAIDKIGPKIVNALNESFALVRSPESPTHFTMKDVSEILLNFTNEFREYSKARENAEDAKEQQQQHESDQRGNTPPPAPPAGHPQEPEEGQNRSVPSEQVMKDNNTRGESPDAGAETTTVPVDATTSTDSASEPPLKPQKDQMPESSSKSSIDAAAPTTPMPQSETTLSTTEGLVTANQSMQSALKVYRGDIPVNESDYTM